MSNPTVVGALIALAGVALTALIQWLRDNRAHTQQIERDKLAQAAQLERDKQTDARAFRIREYERIRGACVQLAAVSRGRLNAFLTVKESPTADSQSAFDALKQSQADSDEAIRVLSVESGTERIAYYPREAREAVTAFSLALGEAVHDGWTNGETPNDGVERAEHAARESQTQLEEVIRKYLVELHRNLGIE